MRYENDGSSSEEWSFQTVFIDMMRRVGLLDHVKSKIFVSLTFNV